MYVFNLVLGSKSTRSNLSVRKIVSSLARSGRLFPGRPVSTIIPELTGKNLDCGGKTISIDYTPKRVSI